MQQNEAGHPVTLIPNPGHNYVYITSLSSRAAWSENGLHLEGWDGSQGQTAYAETGS